MSFQTSSGSSEIQTPSEGKSLLSSVPAWGSYLYSNFLVPAFSPSEWLHLGTPIAPVSFNDYFGDQTQLSSGQQPSWTDNMLGSIDVKREPGQEYPPPPSNYGSSRSNSHPTFPPNSFAQTFHPGAHSFPANQSQPSFQSHYAPPPQSSSYYPNDHLQQSFQSIAGPSMPTSLLLSQTQTRGSASTGQSISPSIEVIDAEIVLSPSPLNSAPVSPRRCPTQSRTKRSRRASTSSSDEQEAGVDVPEGVERDGVIWGMKVENYRALSARERKRVRNRISARTFRAKRKEHLTSLESTLSAKDMQIKTANDEAARLRREVADLRRRLVQYEG